MSDTLESCSCHVWDVDYQIPDDQSIPFPTFNIEIQAWLTKPSYEEQDQDEPSGFLEPESVVIRTTKEVSAELLLNDDNTIAAATVRNMILSMECVPVHDFMVVKFLECARRMAVNRNYRGRKVLRMHVEIEVVVDQLPDDEGESEEGSVSETAAIVEKLTEVVVESPNCCSICLEDLLVGRDATSLACRHFFHHNCIMSWLHKKNHCPLCRRELFS